MGLGDFVDGGLYVGETYWELAGKAIPDGRVRSPPSAPTIAAGTHARATGAAGDIQ